MFDGHISPALIELFPSIHFFRSMWMCEHFVFTSLFFDLYAGCISTYTLVPASIVVSALMLASLFANFMWWIMAGAYKNLKISAAYAKCSDISKYEYIYIHRKRICFG